MQMKPVACLSTLSTTCSSISARSCTSRWASSSAWHAAAYADAPSHLTEEGEPAPRLLTPLPPSSNNCGKRRHLWVKRQYDNKLCRTTSAVAQKLSEMYADELCASIHTHRIIVHFWRTRTFSQYLEANEQTSKYLDILFKTNCTDRK